MDKLIASYPSVPDGDLVLCPANGVAYQADMSVDPVPYDTEYFNKYKQYEGSDIARALNNGRCAMLLRHVKEGSRVLDIGAGCGTFVMEAQTWGFDAYGFDINQATVEFLKNKNRFAAEPGEFDAVTFWDSLEHIENPMEVLCKIAYGAIVLVAIPVFSDLRRIRESKHYRPGEHLYYFTEFGFVGWMQQQGFLIIDRSDHENNAGRESISAFAFRRA